MKAAIENVSSERTYPQARYGAIGEVIGLLVPAVRSIPAEERSLRRCVAANAIAQAQDLSRRGPILAPAVEAGALRVVAAVYDIANGVVSPIG